MSKINTSDATTLTNEISFISLYNANNALIETASNNFLSLDGTSPNSMSASLDMNSNRILNLPAPVASEEPLRLQDLTDFITGGASYVTLGTNSTLTSERVLTAGSGITLTDAGAGSTITVSLTTPITTSANLAALLSDETGTGSVVFGTSPTLTTPVLTSATVTTSLAPTTNDGAPLGDTTHNFSDLFLASGAVINFNAGDVSIVHSSNLLTFTGANSGYSFDAIISTSNSLAILTAASIPAGGTNGAGIRISSTSNFGIFFGSSTPTISAAKGSLYLRSDGTTTNDRAYINTNGTTGWTALTTAA